MEFSQTWNFDTDSIVLTNQLTYTRMWEEDEIAWRDMNHTDEIQST